MILFFDHYLLFFDNASNNSIPDRLEHWHDFYTENQIWNNQTFQEQYLGNDYQDLFEFLIYNFQYDQPIIMIGCNL